MATQTIRQLGLPIADLAGQKIKCWQGHFQIHDLVSRRPPKWEAVCVDCGARTVLTHTALTSQGAICPHCNGKGKSPEQDTIGKVRRREQAAADKRQAAREAADREKLEREEAKLKKSHGNLLKIERENVKGSADESFLTEIFDRETPQSLSQIEATAYNKREAEQFRRECPGYYPSRANMTAIADYLRRNGADQIVSAKTLRQTYQRLNALGLLEQRPAPAQAQVPEPVYRTPVRLEIETAPEPTPEPTQAESIGIDQQTGKRRGYTPWEISRMSASEYARIFQLDRQSRSGLA